MTPKYICFLLLLFLVTACTTDSTNDLIEPIDVDIVSYTEQIQAIMGNNCTSCHGTTPTNGAPMSLSNYDDVKDAVLNRNLIGRISLEIGESGFMPLGGSKLPQPTIDLITQWQTDGFQQ